MKRYLPFSLFFITLICTATVQARAQDAVGGRALGMGGAFTALADGDGAAWWNPASAAPQRRGFRLLLPDLSVFVNGPGGVSDALHGIPSQWNDRFQFARKWLNGITHVSGTVYGGMETGAGTLSLMGFGKGVAVPVDGDGTVGRITMTPEFTIAALREACVQSYQELGFRQTSAQQSADKIVKHVLNTYPGATRVSLPVYGSHVTGSGDMYASLFATIGRQVRPDLRVGINLKMVGAQHLSASARFDGLTFTDAAAQVTGGTASPALVSRVLRRLDLRMADGEYFAGQGVAGDIVTEQFHSGLEVRPSADLGALWQVNSRLRAGGVIRNLIPAHFRNAAPLVTSCDLGMAYMAAPKRLLIAADLTNLLDTSAVRLNVGAEWYVHPLFAVRMGVYRGSLTFGFGLRRGMSLAFTPNGTSQLAFSTGF